MYKEKQVLGLILARGGSKSIPKKSIAPCCGAPLLAYTIWAAKASRLIDRLIISTDDEEMAKTAEELGVEVPFMRPKHLAEDNTPDFPVIEHTLDILNREHNFRPDFIVHLRPTTPLKKALDIDRGVQLLGDNEDADSVRSVCEPPHTPFKMYYQHQNGRTLVPLLEKVFPETYKEHHEPHNLPRQLLPKIWRHSGYVDVVRYETVVSKKSLSGSHILPLEFEAWRDIDIDSPYELEKAELLIKEMKKQGKEPWN